MPTISQLVGSERKRLTKKTKSPALKACIKSKVKYEIIIIDDCSKDNTYVKLRNYKKNIIKKF